MVGNSLLTEWQASATERPAVDAGPLLLTSRQAARALAISERTLWELTRNGEVACIRLGRSVRYDVADLRALIAAKKCGKGN